MVRVWVQLVLWNRVQSLRVKAGGGGFFCCGVSGVVVCWWFGGWERNFRTPSIPLDKRGGEWGIIQPVNPISQMG
jgi:hypothetical protein